MCKSNYLNLQVQVAGRGDRILGLVLSFINYYTLLMPAVKALWKLWSPGGSSDLFTACVISNNISWTDILSLHRASLAISLA